MTGFSNAVETDVLNLVLRGTGYTRHPASLMSLHYADPGDTGINELVNSGSPMTLYARKACAFNAADLVTGRSLLTARVKFDFLPGGPITHFGLWNDTGDFLGSIPSGFAGLLQVYDSFWVETDTVFTLD
jgi:hypothetical protein